MSLARNFHEKILFKYLKPPVHVFPVLQKY